MKWIRCLAVCSTVALALSVAPGVAPPASGAGVLVTSSARVSATPGQTLLLSALFQPVQSGVQYVSFVVTLTGGLTFGDGGQMVAGQALPSVLGLPVTVKSSGTAVIKVIALVDNAPITDEAATAVEVPVPAPTPPVPAPLPGEVRLITSLGTVSATKGQKLSLGSLFKSVEVGKQFNIVRTVISVDMTGGLVFAANGEQSTGLGGTNAMFDALLIGVVANSSGTVRLRVTAKTANFDITDEATATVNVPGSAPAPPPAPVATPAPVPRATVGSSGNRPPTAVGKSVVVKASTATVIVLKGTDPEGAALVYSVVEFPEHGRLTGRAPNLTYVPEKGFVGADAFTFTVSDRVSASEEAVVSVTVISAKRVAPKKVVAKKVVVRTTTKKK